MLTPSDALSTLKDLLAIRVQEAQILDRLHAYWRGTQPLPVVPSAVPDEVRRMAEMSRVNLTPLVVDIIAQSAYVDGFRQPDGSDDDPVWDIWQANKMDARQIGVHRSTAAYGASYVVVLPGTPVPVIRGASPRNLTAAYESDPDWPVYAVEVDKRLKTTLFRLYDETHVYEFRVDNDAEPDNRSFRVAREHGVGNCPIVRFRNQEDLEGDIVSEITPLMPIQDQIDLTTFELLVAQHFQSFRQRYIIGWTSDDEEAKAKAAASRLWTFDDDVKVGEFGQVDLGGYLESRSSALEFLATVSQTPPHHLLGKMVNLSAEALTAAESGQRRKLTERETTWGESWEQVLQTAGKLNGTPIAEDAQVRWRDTEARSLSQTADALVKLLQLGVPPQALWERIPGVTQQDVEEWKRTLSESDPLAALDRLLDDQATPATP